MKYVYLALLRIQHYFTKNKFIFVLYSLGIILCAVIMTFLIGNGNRANNHNYSFRVKAYTINFQTPMEADEIKKNIDTKDSVIDYENILFLSSLPVEQIKFSDEKIKIVELIWLENGKVAPKENFIIGTYLNNDELKDEQYYRRTEFSKQEENGGNAIVCNYETVLNFTKSNSNSMQIENMPFNIIGLTYNDFADAYLPYKTYNNLHLNINSILIEMKDLPSASQNKDIVKTLEDIFEHKVNIESPESYIKAQEDDYIKNMLESIIIVAITLITFISLMKYMLERSRYETIIFNSVGATSRKLFLIMILENIFIVIPATIIGILVYSCIKNVFSLLAYAPGYTYTLNDYIFVIISLMIVSIIISLPFYIMCIKKSLISMKNLYTS